MRIVFTRDRPAQLDLLLRSIALHMEPEDTTVIGYASTPKYAAGYRQVEEAFPFAANGEGYSDFNGELRQALDEDADGTVTFFCDDDVVYRPVKPGYQDVLAKEKTLLTVSLRLGTENEQMRLPRGFPCWHWFRLPRHDFGFPASIDGHTFRTEDVLRLVGDDAIENPTNLETIMAHRVEGLSHTRPLMTCFPEQKLVGIPVNRVSETSGVPNGEFHPQGVESLLHWWSTGYRISLDDLDFSRVDGCHHEVPFTWEKRP